MTRYHEKSRPGKAKIICATFSPGGIFFCTGSADHNVRVYQINCPEGVQRILEDDMHDDQVLVYVVRMSFAESCLKMATYITGLSCQITAQKANFMC